MKFLFWNMQKKELSDQLAELILENKPDIACFAESTQEIIENTLTIVNKTSTSNYSLINNPGCDKLKIITRLDKAHFDLLNQSKDFSLLRFISGGKRFYQINYWFCSFTVEIKSFSRTNS
ncbi:hypothetical protein [uncultured Tolumonas sp.]|uniref:hypothetical protein n=1 Tax=uncultured Tolumonas sp. TaxID=263765 RepID=UPI002A0A91DF|nr:hypothetical protein [uncultured Tolumonas sp.]